MTPDLNLEAYLCAHIRTQNFDASRAQIVPATNVDLAALVLPRIVVECASGTDPVMAQAGVFPVNVTATLLFNARESEDLYLLDPLKDAVINALQFPGIARRELVETTVELPTGDIIVSGAGTGNANATYSPRGTENGRLYYNKIGQPDSTTLNAIVWTGNWSVTGPSFELFYYSFDDVATPDLVDTWDVDSEGIAPTPTVTAQTEPQTTIQDIEVNPASSFRVAIYGSTLGDVNTTQADDRIEVTVGATLHARRI
jgi:hypothetical protein